MRFPIFGLFMFMRMAMYRYGPLGQQRYTQPKPKRKSDREIRREYKRGRKQWQSKHPYGPRGYTRWQG